MQRISNMTILSGQDILGHEDHDCGASPMDGCKGCPVSEDEAQIHVRE